MKYSYKLVSMVLLMLLTIQADRSVRAEAPLATELCNELAKASIEVLVNGKISGSGAFVSSDGYVLTAAHFMKIKMGKLEVLSKTAGRHLAKLVAIDKGHDLALLKIETKKELSFLPISKKPPQPGQTIYTLGSPLNRHALFLRGMIASQEADYEYLTDQETYIGIWYVQVMSPRGLSGGNWVNSKGHIIGVQSGFLNEQVGGTGGTANSGVAFVAGPKAIDNLVKSKKHAETPSVGGIVEELWTQVTGFQARFPAGTEGVVIHQVRKGGPLEKAGLGHEDLIIEADGKKVRYRKDLLEIIRKKIVGDSVRIGYIKPDGKETGIKEVTLDALERNWLDNDN